VREREVLLDCDEGRRKGCTTFCCRLIVRLTAEERALGLPGVEQGMNCMPKTADGLCVHLDPATERCRIWSERPLLCRTYDCNTDELLPIVLRHGFRSLVHLVTVAARERTESSRPASISTLGEGRDKEEDEEEPR
jgi:hypothetical protein